MSSQKTNRKSKHSYSGFWLILVAAVVLESTAFVQYFYSRTGIRAEAEERAKSELRRAELEIEKHTVEMEAAAKTLAMLAEKNVNSPKTAFAATRDVVATIDNTTSVAVAYIPNYFPKQGKYCEVCSSRISEDSIYTRQIGSEEHDYTKMEWFQNGLKIDSCWWSEPYLDDSGSKTYVVSCSHPVRDKSGKVVAVVCVDLSLDYLQDVSEFLQVYPQSFYSITSGTGLEIVAAPDTITGRKYQIFNEEIDATGWHISIIIPEGVIYADLRRIGLIVSLMMFIGLALLVFIVYRAGKDTAKLVDTTTQNERMESELNIASAIQMAMLPKVFPPFMDRLDMNAYGMVKPAKEVGGDLYDFYVRHDKLFFCIGDVSGKGVPAALVMATMRSLFRSVTSHEERAAKIVAEINNTLADQNDQNMFVTFFLGVLDFKTGKMEYCNAGHNAPVLHRRLLDVKPNLPLGIVSGYEFEAQSIQMEYNDTIFLYTDGLTEAENEQHEQYGEERMLQTLAALTDSRPREVVEAMLEHIETFVNGAQQSDDLTMLFIRYQKPALIMRNDIQQIPSLPDWIDSLGIPQELNMPINLALEEAVSNVMLYAYPNTKSGIVIVEFARTTDDDGDHILFTISDSGIPFDPTQQEEADISLSAEDRAIGGLGIHLVRKLMDRITYRREDEKNVLTLIKKI